MARFLLISFMGLCVCVCVFVCVLGCRMAQSKRNTDNIARNTRILRTRGAPSFPSVVVIIINALPLVLMSSVVCMCAASCLSNGDRATGGDAGTGGVTLAQVQYSRIYSVHTATKTERSERPENLIYYMNGGGGDCVDALPAQRTTGVVFVPWHHAAGWRAMVYTNSTPPPPPLLAMPPPLWPRLPRKTHDGASRRHHHCAAH